jgi:HAD superfamily hydrolase (TIGR01509 family)
MSDRQYDAILFDFDGVLADTEPVHCQCWAEVLRPLGIHLDWPTFEKYCVGVPDPQVVEFLCRRNDPPVDVAAAWARAERKRELFRARMREAPPLTPAVIGMIRSLSGSGLRLAVVTASARSEIEPVLERAGIRSCFGALVCRDDVARTKPAPDAYLTAARLLNAANPLVVEDSEAGIAAGLAAGFEVLRVASPAGLPGLLAEHLGSDAGPPQR